jgi:YD repeat-containing protein
MPAMMLPFAERSASGHQPGGWGVFGALIIEGALTRGPDGSGRFEGAGGVGGLLMMEEKPGSTTDVPVGTYYPLYDGNGNITQLLDSAGGVAAHYDYDAFGNVAVATGPAAVHNPWRFSKPRQLRLVQVISCDDWRGRDPCPDNASTEDFEKAFTTGC